MKVHPRPSVWSSEVRKTLRDVMLPHRMQSASTEVKSMCITGTCFSWMLNETVMILLPDEQSLPSSSAGP